MRQLGVAVCCVLVACGKRAERVDDYRLDFAAGKLPATVKVGDKTLEVAAKSTATIRVKGHVEVNVTVGDEHATWSIDGRPDQHFAVPVSARQCFASLSQGVATKKARPYEILGGLGGLSNDRPLEYAQIPCDSEMTVDEVRAFVEGHGSYEDIVVTGRESDPTAETCTHRDFADAIAAATGYEVVSCEKLRSLLVKGTSVVALSMPYMDGEGSKAHIDEVIAMMKKPVTDWSDYVVGAFAPKLGLTYASIVAEFPAMYARAATRDVEVADAGSYGGMRFLYGQFPPFATKAEVAALAKAGVNLAATVDAQVAAAAKDVDACVAMVKKARVVCSKDKTVAEAATRLLALLARPDTHVVVRIVNIEETAGATLELYPAGATPAGDPNGTLPYAVAIDGTSVRAVGMR